MDPAQPNLRPPFGWSAFGAWSLGLIVLKGLFILFLADVYFYGEELEKGSVAKALIDGVPIDFFRLTYHYYEGGGLFISVLKALAFQLVGENLLAHRLLGLATCWAVFFGLWRLTNAHFGRRAAHLAAALFVLGPSGFQRFSLLSLGIHFEAMALGLPLLDEGLRLVRWRTWNPSPRRVLAVGMLAGFGVFCSYQNLLILGWVGLWVLALRWRWLCSRAGILLALGVLVGLLPMGYMAWNVGTALFDVHGTELTQLGSNRAKLMSFLRSLYVGVEPWTVILRVWYPLAGALVIGFAVWYARRTRVAEAFLLGFVLVWLLAWYKGPFLAEEHVHYFAWLRWAPVVLVTLALASGGLDLALSQEGAPSWLARVLTGLTLAAGLVQAGQIVHQSQWRTPKTNLANLLHWKGYNYRGHFRTLLKHLPDQEPNTLRALLAFREPSKDLLYADIATSIIGNSTVARSPVEWKRWFEIYAPDRIELFVRGMGPALVQPFGGDVSKALDALRDEDPKWRARYAEAIGYYGSGWNWFPEQIRNELLTTDSETRPSEYFRGVGSRIFRVCVVYPYGRGLVLNPEAAKGFITTMPTVAIPLLLEGFDQEQARWRLDLATNQD